MIGAETALLHASCVAVDGRGLLILGPSGCGKSSLALQMMALGAGLVADDQVVLVRQDDLLWASAPPALHGLIEARGVGLLRAEMLDGAVVHLAVDLGGPMPPRLPERHTITILGKSIDLVQGPLNGHLAAALLVYLRCGRQD